MITGGALDRRGLALEDESAVAAVPLGGGGFNIDIVIHQMLGQLVVAGFMLFFDLGDVVKAQGQLLEAFLAGNFCKAFIHFGPLVVFSGGGRAQVLQRISGLGAFGQFAQRLKPEFRVLLLVESGLGKDAGDLLIALFLGRAGKIVILVAGHALAGKGGVQILLGS